MFKESRSCLRLKHIVTYCSSGLIFICSADSPSESLFKLFAKGQADSFDRAKPSSDYYAYDDTGDGACLDCSRESLLEDVARYPMTWPFGKTAVTKMSDFDLSDPSCGNQPLAQMDWNALHTALLPCAQHRPSADDVCGAVQASRPIVGKAVQVDTRYTSHRNECFLGVLSLHLCDLLCELLPLAEAPWADPLSLHWFPRWQKVQLELEGLFDYLEYPLSRVLSSRWGIPSIMASLARSMRTLMEIRHPNLCDKAGIEADAEFAKRMDEEGKVSPEVAGEFVQSSLLQFHVGQKDGRCAFSVVIALLSSLLYQMRSKNAGIPRFSPEELLDAHIQALLRTWEDSTPQFFYDMLTTRWPVWDLMEKLGEAWPKTPGSAVLAAELGEEAKKELQAIPSGFKILLVGGGETTYQWGSFTVRGRQLARGFRLLGIDARTWHMDCDSWCRYHQEDSWSPNAIIHIKYVCECALEVREAIHAYDQIDIYAQVPLTVDAIVVQTSLGWRDLSEHPPLHAGGSNVSVWWIPLHHSNAHNIRIDPLKPVERVGLHTVHADEYMSEIVKPFLNNVTDGTVQWVHFDPATLFPHGRVVTPQQTDAVYAQLSTLDIAFAKQSGCLTEWWMCSRYKTGQRFLNLLSLGIPTIVWGDCQGHIDVAFGHWPPDAKKIPPYPLVVYDEKEVLPLLEALLQNASLRSEASAIGLQIADRFSLPEVAARYGALLAGLYKDRVQMGSRLTA